MAEFGRVVIVGVGLLGGSIGLGLRKRNLADLVVGFGRSMEALQAAKVHLWYRHFTKPCLAMPIKTALL